ncbi:MAG TPA: hypothetical protein VFZ09_12430 [Archangium sp.]|uniref:hypothetical protein n=1 Tax=Archangium sp. TaxID=1872627 RepID=UPI002E34CD2E|nr:hypothetical protein [Archangium sp.]HEX5747044.1 hypothetical protein [Archangium sp.]
MLFFLIVMCVGLVGLSAMAIPGVFHHGHLGHGSGHVTHAPGHVAHAGHGFMHFLPEPRLLFSLLALYGAFGNVLALTLSSLWLVALLALLPALLVERFVLAPLWKLAFQFQGRPSSPLPALLMEDARAVTPFRNGKGLVRVIRDGRSVQLSARLVEGQSMLPVQVGDKLRIEEIDPENERVTVSLF